MAKEQDPFGTNPDKASAKIRINNNLIAACLTIFGMIWALAPGRLTSLIILQFVIAIPLLYASNIAYTKIAYWKKVKLWEYMGWFAGTTGTALVFNILGLLIFSLGFAELAIVYFVVMWLCLLAYTLINIHYSLEYNPHPKDLNYKVFKLFYFISIQLVFGIIPLYI